MASAPKPSVLLVQRTSENVIEGTTIMSNKDRKPEEKQSDHTIRLDFEITDLEADPDTGMVRGAFVLDRRRYDIRDRDGKKWIVDRLDNLWFPVDMVNAEFEKLVGQPIFYTPQTLGDASRYVQSRISHIRASLEGETVHEEILDKSEEFLESLSADEEEFIILVVDLVGSTRLVQTLSPETYARVIATLSFELSHLVPDFHGYILKFTGDGLIAYFSNPRVMIKHDHAIDCALTMQLLVREGLNVVHQEIGLPPLELRIGVESGLAAVLTLGSSRAKRHRDVIGAVVNMAAKIQSLASPGEVYLGRRCVENLLIDWRLELKEVATPSSWQYIDPRGGKYAVYKYVGPRALVASASLQGTGVHPILAVDVIDPQS